MLGMHRSGTSALARGLQALGVYLGDNFLDAQPDNPTGYWEDRNIFAINEHLLALSGLTWEDYAPIDDARWHEPEVASLLREAVDYIGSTFAIRPLWGFKDPRTIRLLPFWQSALRAVEADDSYVVMIRNPRSVAASLTRRQGMETPTAHLLWLAYMVPHLSMVSDRRFVVIDYDLLMAEPRQQLERIAQRLDLQLDNRTSGKIAEFANHFLDPDLRHNFYNPTDLATDPSVPLLSHEAYLWLRRLATDQSETDAPEFWAAWESNRKAVTKLISSAGAD
jgi:hypothetical protein